MKSKKEIFADILADLDKKSLKRPTKSRFKVTFRMDDICLVKNIKGKHECAKNGDRVSVIREYADGTTSVKLLNRKFIDEDYYIETKYLIKL